VLVQKPVINGLSIPRTGASGGGVQIIEWEPILLATKLIVFRAIKEAPPKLANKLFAPKAFIQDDNEAFF